MRRGTRSCVECRRRKLRCSWPSENSSVCQRCVEKGITCQPQTESPNASRVPKTGSKQRIAQLESKVSQLERIVDTVYANSTPRHGRLDSGTTAVSESVADERHDTMDEDEDDHDDMTSDTSEIVVEEPNGRINTLFQNEYLHSDTRQNAQMRAEQLRNSVTQSLDEARTLLQRLIPTREDVAVLAEQLSPWLGMLAEMMPYSSFAASHTDLILSYDSMSRPDVDPWTLASWLLSLALTSQQIPKGPESPASYAQMVRKHHQTSRKICEAVEKSILSHDSLLGTLQGLELGLLYLRVMLAGGNMQKTWLYLRRLIAIAELIGLPRAAKLHHARKHSANPEERQEFSKARIWDAMCAIERISGMLNNFPIATRPYELPADDPLTNDGQVRPFIYLMRLSTIAAGIPELDDFRLAQRPDAEGFAAVLNLDTKLRMLASCAPVGWWDIAPEPGAIASPADTLRFLHYCTAMQIHIFFVLRKDPSLQFIYSKQCGIDACQNVLLRWRVLRDSMPFGFFLYRMIHIQAFTAVVILLLTVYGCREDYELATISDAQRSSIEDLIAVTMALMESDAKSAGTGLAENIVMSVRSLQNLLAGRTIPNDTSLKLTVPVLGTIHVQRRYRGIDGQGIAPMPTSQNMAWDNAIGTAAANMQYDPHPSFQTDLIDIGGTTGDQSFAYQINYDSDAMFQNQFDFGAFDNFSQWPTNF